MEWAHAFELALTAFGVFFLYEFQLLQKGLIRLSRDLTMIREDMREIVTISKAHEERLRNVELAAPTKKRVINGINTSRP